MRAPHFDSLATFSCCNAATLYSHLDKCSEHPAAATIYLPNSLEIAWFKDSLAASIRQP